MQSEFVMGPEDAQLVMQDDELSRIFFKTDKLSFGVSEIPVGKSSILDPGHMEGDEVFYIKQGQVVCRFPHDNSLHEVKCGQAMLIPAGTSHQVFNISNERVIIIWVCAPHA